MRFLSAATAAAALVLLLPAPASAEPVNQAPVAVDDAVSITTTPQSHTVWALGNDSDPDGDRLTYTAVSPATHGRAYLESGQLRYQPLIGALPGTDSFTYTVSDGNGNTATATVTVTLWNDPTVPQGVTVSSAGEGAVTLTWRTVTDAVQYRIHSGGVVVGTTTDVSWTATGLDDSQIYWFSVTAVNSGGAESAWSDTVVRQNRQTTPWALTVDPTDDPTSLVLDWAESTSGTYDVYRDGALVASTSASEYTDTGLTTGREYSYQVRRTAASSAIVLFLPSTLTTPVTGAPGVVTPIGRLFRDLGGRSGVLGAVTVAERAVPGGRQQDHENGRILQRDGDDPYSVGNDFARALDVAGGPTFLGFPLSDQECGLVQGGCVQSFEHGSIWRSATTRAFAVRPAIEDGWAATGGEEGPLGYPVADQFTVPAGVGQQFEDGTVYWSAATGARIVSGAIYGAYAVAYGAYGVLGLPTTDTFCGLRGGGCWQGFQGGTIHWSPTTGAHATSGLIRDTWAATGWEEGPLGYPVAGQFTSPGGGGQLFEDGGVYWSAATGSHAVTGAVHDVYSSRSSVLGFPTTDLVCGLRGDGCWQGFRGATVHWSPASGAHVSYGWIRDAWARTGWENGFLGYPTTDPVCGLRDGGCWQGFQGATVHSSSATGARLSYGWIRDAWARTGWENGFLGYLTTDPVCGLRGGGCWQGFQGGTIHSSAASGAHVSYGWIRDAWARTGWENGPLGYPTTDPICGLALGGCWQGFQGGTIHSSSATGAHVSYGWIRDAWARTGWENGSLGYPTTDPVCGLRGGGCWQGFQGGTIHSSPATGAQITTGWIRDAWGRTGWENGRLGYPTGPRVCDARGDCSQPFQGGTITSRLGFPQVVYR
ncbi:Ig-like domain-containing protein [Blastococcus sp. SYSU D00820]